MTVCYFGAYNRNDPRNRVLLRSLNESGVIVLECNSLEKGLKKYVSLYRKLKDIQGKYDIIFVAFPGYATTVLAKLLDFRRTIILDAYISYYDTLLDRKNYPRFHPRLLLALLLDKLSTLIADEVLTINGEYKKFFVDVIKTRESKMHVIRKGADESLFYPRKRDASVKKTKFIVGWYGTYIPLHGVEYIIEAAKILRNSRDIEFQLVGGGQMFDTMKNLAARFDSRNIKFLSRCPYEEIPSFINKADVVLGIFSPNPKAMRCVTNKVYEAMAMGKAIITENSPANREIFTHGENVYLCEAGSGEAIARAIGKLKDDPDFKKKLEVGVLRLFQDRFSQKNIAEDLMHIVKKDSLQEDKLDKQKLVNFYDSFYGKRGIGAIRTYQDYEEKFFNLSRHARFIKNQRLLDVGCGTGQFLKVAEKASLAIHGLEISPKAVELAKTNVPRAQLRIGEAESLPFDSNFFDYVTCLGSLEHFADLHAAVGEMMRVANDNAIFLIMVPNRNYLFWKILGSIGTRQREHREVLLDLNQWKTFFTDHGLRIEKLYHDRWPQRSVPIFKFKDLRRIVRRLVYHAIWLLLPLAYTYQFVFILKKSIKN